MNIGQSRSTSNLLKSLLLGEEWAKTQRALLLAAGFLVVLGGFDLILQSISHHTVPRFVYGFRRAFLIETGYGQLVDLAYQPGFFVAVGLAAIQAYFNAGYLPSILLATAPIYPVFVFTVPGPRTLAVIRLGDDLVFAPYWAAEHVLPNTITYGTIGFLIGIGLQYTIRRSMTDTTSS